MAWPATATLGDLQTCETCGIRVYADTPGSLQVLTRRQGNGAGDGVNIEENTSIGADYRGQRYTFQEAILHVPGLHVFPGNKEVYPAEYHIHMQTFSKPQRALTLVLPVTHRTPDATGVPGEEYFAAVAARPDPAATRPALGTLLVAGQQMLQYQGPDIRGRTTDTPKTPACDPENLEERQFLLALGAPLRIRAMDLERIPREGSLSTNPRDLPAPGIRPKAALPRDRLRRCVVLASPGILGSGAQPIPKPAPKPVTSELECKPLKVVDGVDVVDMSGQSVNILDLLGVGGGASGLQGRRRVLLGATDASDQAAVAAATAQVSIATKIASSFAALFGAALGFLLANWILGWFWRPFFLQSARRDDSPWLQIKIIVFAVLMLGAAASPFITNQ